MTHRRPPTPSSTTRPVPRGAGRSAHRRGRLRPVLAASALVLGLAACDQATIIRVNGDFPYTPETIWTHEADISDDGSIVAFSTTRRFDPNDTGNFDIVVTDRNQQLTYRISATATGSAANGHSLDPRVSGNGRYVVWSSDATDLAPGDTNGRTDVFRYDLQTGALALVSVSTGGAQGNGDSENPAISDDGRYVAFQSAASNLVGGDGNGRIDVFVRDLSAGTTTRASVASDGSERIAVSNDPAISGDGKVVAFATAAPLVADDTNGVRDVYRRDGLVTSRVSTDASGGDPNGTSEDPSLNVDGSVVAFESEADDLDPLDTDKSEDVFVWEDGAIALVSLDSGTTTGDGPAEDARLDSSGTLVGYSSTAAAITGSDTREAVIHDRSTRRTHVVSTSVSGTPGSAYDELAAISGNGRAALVRSLSEDLIPDDTNQTTDIFVKSFPFPKVTSVSPATLTPGSSTLVTIDGRGFAGPMTVTADPNPGGNLTIGAVTIVSPTRIRVQITVPAGAAPMAHDLTVTNQGVFPDDTPGASTVCQDCLTVT